MWCAHSGLSHAAVTYGCIPCELRSLFVESMRGSDAAECGTDLADRSSLHASSPQRFSTTTGAATNNSSASCSIATPSSTALTATATAAACCCCYCYCYLLLTETYCYCYYDFNHYEEAKRQFPAVVPSNLLYSVWTFADQMAGYEQQDAHEFFIALLDGVETHLQLYHASEPSAVLRWGENGKSMKRIRDNIPSTRH